MPRCKPPRSGISLGNAHAARCRRRNAGCGTRRVDANGRRTMRRRAARTYVVDVALYRTNRTFQVIDSSLFIDRRHCSTVLSQCLSFAISQELTWGVWAMDPRGSRRTRIGAVQSMGTFGVRTRFMASLCLTCQSDRCDGGPVGAGCHELRPDGSLVRLRPAAPGSLRRWRSTMRTTTWAATVMWRRPMP